MKIAKRLHFNRPRRPDPVTRYCARCDAPNAAWGFDAWKSPGVWFCWGCVPPELSSNSSKWVSLGEAAQQVLDVIQTAKDSTPGGGES